MTAQDFAATERTTRVLLEIQAELHRARRLYPDCDILPDGTGGMGRRTYETISRNACERAAREGLVTHAHVLEEEASEVLAAEDPAELRRELVQLGACVVRWLESLDRRAEGTVRP